MLNLNPPTEKEQRRIDAMIRLQRKQLRTQRMGRMLSMTDRILDHQVIDVVVEKTDAIAYTDGATIHLSSSMLPSLDTPKGVATWLGANYHELGHVMYTPRNDSPLKQRIKAAGTSYLAGAHSAWNILEDQREERLMIAQFAPLRAYLSLVVVDMIAGDGEAADTWPLLAGRTWLTDDVRDASRAAFAAAHGETVTAEVAEIIGDFQRLSDTGYTEAEVAFDLVERFTHLLISTQGTVPPTGCVFKGTAGEDEAAGTDAVPAADQPTYDMPERDEDEDEDEGVEGQESGGEGTDESDEDAPEDGQAGDVDTDTTDESDGSGSGQAAGAEGSDKQPSAQDIAEAIESAVESMIADDDDIAADMDHVEDALEKGMGDDAEGFTVQSHTMEATHDQQVTRRNVEDHLARIIELAEPRTLRRVDHGKINVGRYVTAQSFDPSVMFDRWEAGQDDEVSVELVILLDISGSMMGDSIQHASASVWAALHAVDRAEGLATVLTYDTRHTVMVRKHDRPNTDVQVPRSGGGTDPSSALDQAYRILSESDAKHRILLSVTDGEWYSGESHVQALGQDGVITAMCLISGAFDPASRYYRHDIVEQRLERGRNGHQFVTGSGDGSGIADLFDKIASDSMMGALA